jgi:ferrochelatase
VEYIPALNAEPDHARVLAQLCWRHGQGWPEFGGGDGPDEAMLQDRVKRADAAAARLGLPD